MKNYFKKFSIMFGMSLILMLGCCTSAFADDSIKYEPKKDYSANLVAKWVFDNTSTNYVNGTILKDVSGHGYDGTMSNVTFNTDKDLGTCAYFDGKSSFVKFNNPIIPQNKFFIVIKMKVTDTLDNQGFNKCILSNQDEAYDYSGIDIRMIKNSISVKSQRQETATAKSLIWGLDNNFSNYNNEEVIAVSYDNLNKVAKLYENNLLQPICTAHTSNEVPPLKYNLSIGISNNTHTGYADKGYFKGSIKSIEIYNDVVEYEAKTSEISLDQSSMDLTEGNSGQLTATTTPAGAEVVWISSDSSIATVDSSGKVTAIKEGQTTITTQIKDSETKATCVVTVLPKGTNPPIDPTTPTGDANLFIELVDGNIKSYNVSSAEITKFKQWYLDRDNTKSNKPYYEFSKGDYKDYVIHEKIDWFEVR